MEIALIHDNQLILGPMGFNVRMINSELEDLEIRERIIAQNRNNLPIHFPDGLTHLVAAEIEIPDNDIRYHNIGNYSWEIIKENDIPVRVKFTYSISDKTLEEVKNNCKQQIPSARKQRENKVISLTVNGTEIQVATSREERLLLASKLLADPGPHNYKFINTWLEITTEELQYIISEIDKSVQEAYDWEYSQLEQIDSCTNIDDIYNLIQQATV